jgi:hypothetical protein
MPDQNGNTQTQQQQPAQVTINTTKPSDFPEMPYSWNVTAVSPEGFNEMFTVRAVNEKPFLDRITQIKKYLTASNYKPAAQRGAAGAPAASASEPTEQAPICAIHHEPLKKRQGTGGKSFWSCPKKLEDGSWCPYRPKS